jgi:hypothetical protein
MTQGIHLELWSENAYSCSAMWNYVHNASLLSFVDNIVNAIATTCREKGAIISGEKLN